MGLMMSVLVFSIGVLEALACVEHVRQSFLPLDLGRKRRRLVLDVGSGTIRHRETRRSSEFQRDPHMFLRSIQAAVEEEGDEKESAELAAIFESVEAHNMHSTQIINHQDPLFLTVNDIEESDSYASSELSRTSTPNTVIMNVSPELDRESNLEPSYIPTDSFSEPLGPERDKAFLNQKDINVAQVEIDKFMCISKRAIVLESEESYGQSIDEKLQSSNKQNNFKDSSVCNITTEVLVNEKTEIEEGVIAAIDIDSTDNISIQPTISGNEINTKDKEVSYKNDEITSYFAPDSLKDEEQKAESNIKNKNDVNFEPELISKTPSDDNNICLKLCEINAVHDNEKIIQNNNLDINHKVNENSSNLTDTPILAPNNEETIEKRKILVKSQPHSEKKPLIENKDKSDICDTQLEQVTGLEKQSNEDEIRNSTFITNSVNVALTSKNDENNRKEIIFIDQLIPTCDFSKHENSAILPKLENDQLQGVLLHTTQRKESEMVSIKSDESKDNVIVEDIDGMYNNDAPNHETPVKILTKSDSERKIETEGNIDDLDVCERKVADKGHFNAADPIPSRTGVSSELKTIVDPEIMKQVKEVIEEKRNDVFTGMNTLNSIDFMNPCIDNNFNIVNKTCLEPGEKKTQPENGQPYQKILASDPPETIEHYDKSAIEHDLIPASQERIVSFQQELEIDSRASTIEKQDASVKSHVVEKNNVAEMSEGNKIERKGANVNAHCKSESAIEVSNSEEKFDELRQSANSPEEAVNIKKEFGLEKLEQVIKSKIIEKSVKHLTDLISDEPSKDECISHINPRQTSETEESSIMMEEYKPFYHSPKNHEKVISESTISEESKSEGVDAEMTHSMNSTVSNESTSQDILKLIKNTTTNEVDTTEKLHPVARKLSNKKNKIVSNEEITSKDLLNVKESLKPLPQKEPAEGGVPSDRTATKKNNGVLTKQETLKVSPFPDDVTVLEGAVPSQNEFTPVEDITSPDKAFWLIFSGEYTKAMSKDWHSGHFCCWQCDESLTGQRYVLRDDHPYCIKCYEQVFANTCDECSKVIGIDSKDLSYKDKHWHEACFLCSKCRVSLVDKQFGSKADKIYCGNCYDAQFASRCDGCGQIFRAGKCIQ